MSLSRISALSSPYSYFISVPSSALASSAIPPCSPVVGCADFFLGYRPVDRAAIRWTAIRIDYSLPKLRRGAFILYNSPAALLPCSFLASSSLAITARRRPRRPRRRRLVRDVNRALARASAKQRWERGSTRPSKNTDFNNIPENSSGLLADTCRYPRVAALRRSAIGKERDEGNAQTIISTKKIL